MLGVWEEASLLAAGPIEVGDLEYDRREQTRRCYWEWDKLQVAYARILPSSKPYGAYQEAGKAAGKQTRDVARGLLSGSVW